MRIDRIKEIQEQTAYPDSVSVQQALLQVWNECELEKTKTKKMTRKEAALILRAIAMTDYRYEDEDEIMQMQDIKMKLMHIHPEQDAAKERGHRLTIMLNRLLISLVALMLLSSLLIAYLYA